jgi:hypothetical protein
MIKLITFILIVSTFSSTLYAKKYAEVTQQIIDSQYGKHVSKVLQDSVKAYNKALDNREHLLGLIKKSNMTSESRSYLKSYIKKGHRLKLSKITFSDQNIFFKHNKKKISIGLNDLKSRAININDKTFIFNSKNTLKKNISRFRSFLKRQFVSTNLFNSLFNKFIPSAKASERALFQIEFSGIMMLSYVRVIGQQNMDNMIKGLDKNLQSRIVDCKSSENKTVFELKSGVRDINKVSYMLDMSIPKAQINSCDDLRNFAREPLFTGTNSFDGTATYALKYFSEKSLNSACDKLTELEDCLNKKPEAISDSTDVKESTPQTQGSGQRVRKVNNK